MIKFAATHHEITMKRSLSFLVETFLKNINDCSECTIENE